MERRKFLNNSLGVIGLGVLASNQNAFALISCTPYNMQGFQQCEVGIDSGLAHISATATNGQHMSQWCWAACIEMVFKYYGYHVPQEVIVQQTWGGLVNNPGQPNHILANLNRFWVDAYGKGFYVSGETYSSNQITAAQDLSQNMPLIIGTMGHAMVLTSLTYNKNQWGNGQVLSAVVRDPWPKRGRKVLAAKEWYSTSFLARIRITPA